MNETRHPEYVIRVKLPSSSGYHSSPSGDSDFEDAYDSAIAKAMPPGFSVVKQQPNEKWAKDSEGRSMILIWPHDIRETVVSYSEQTKRLQEKLDKIKGIIG